MAPSSLVLRKSVAVTRLPQPAACTARCSVGIVMGTWPSVGCLPQYLRNPKVWLRIREPWIISLCVFVLKVPVAVSAIVLKSSCFTGSSSSPMALVVQWCQLIPWIGKMPNQLLRKEFANGQSGHVKVKTVSGRLDNYVNWTSAFCAYLPPHSEGLTVYFYLMWAK